MLLAAHESAMHIMAVQVHQHLASNMYIEHIAPARQALFHDSGGLTHDGGDRVCEVSNSRHDGLNGGNVCMLCADPPTTCGIKCIILLKVLPLRPLRL